MMRFSTILFMIQVLWCSVLLADATMVFERAITIPSVQKAGKPKVENLKGKDVIVRLYDDWQNDPVAFEKIPIQLKNNTVCLDFPDSSNSAIVVVIGEDQKDAVVKKALGDCIYAEFCRKRLWFCLDQSDSSGRKYSQWTFVDALGNRIVNATVQMFLGHSLDPTRTWIRTVQANDQGKLNGPGLAGVFKQIKLLYLVVSHPDYGVAVVEPSMEVNGTVYMMPGPLPLVRIGTQAAQRSIRGTVVDRQGNLIFGTLIECKRAYTLGGGPIYPLNGYRYLVLSDEAGEFSMYLPNRKDPRDNDRGDLVPPKSKYDIRIEAPKEFGFLQYIGQVVNGRHITITMERGEYFHTFVFEDEIGRLFDTNQLNKMTLFIERPNKPKLRFGYTDWKDGSMFPLGTYRATIWTGWRIYEFEPIEVTIDSPEQLVFRLPQDSLYCGLVVDGSTGEPMCGTFVIAKSSIYTTRNLCQITLQQWQMLHAIPANPSVDDENLAPLREICVFDEIVRTDEDGRFEINFRPGGQYCELVVFQENYLSVQRNVPESTYTAYRRIELPITRLFPSAKVTIAAVAGNQSPVVEVSWYVNKEESPHWVNGLLSIEDDSETHFAHHRWNKNPQTLPVPAELNIQIQIRAKWDRRWCPLTVDQPIYLMQGHTLDLGQFTLQPMVKVAVITVDSMGEPVEGVPVKYITDCGLASLVYNTNEDGIAWINVPPYSRGSFVVDTHIQNQRSQETLPYEIASQERNEDIFIMTLSDDIIQNLFR